MAKGQVKSKAERKAYGPKCVEGDIITVTLEIHQAQGSLSFEVNGQELGVAFQEIKTPLFPMVCLPWTHNHLTILD